MAIPAATAGPSPGPPATRTTSAATLAITTIDTGNPATNVIPAKAKAAVNIRFNDAHTSHSLAGWLRAEAAEVQEETGVTFTLDVHVSGESFLTPPGDFVRLVAGSVKTETGKDPALSTSGGTSDARFVKDHCPVVEFGLVGKTMHQVDERVLHGFDRDAVSCALG